MHILDSILSYAREKGLYRLSTEKGSDEEEAMQFLLKATPNDLEVTYSENLDTIDWLICKI